MELNNNEKSNEKSAAFLWPTVRVYHNPQQLSTITRKDYGV